jgi:hypothetical protein
MTLISAESKTRTRGSSSASLTTFTLRGDILKAEDIVPVRAMPTRSYSKLITKKPASSNLVEEFINTQKELESYKLVQQLLIYVIILIIYIGMASPSLSMVKIFPSRLLQQQQDMVPQ